MKYKKEDLENYINVKKLSYEEIGRMYNVSGTAIKKAAIKLGISLSARRNINKKETRKSFFNILFTIILLTS